MTCTIERTNQTDAPAMSTLLSAVQDYFDLMYDCDTSRFDDVFLPTVYLHGFRDGRMVAWSAETYRGILDKRLSPKAQGSTRADEVLLVDFASSTQAMVKARLRIAAQTFVDHLTWHRLDGRWLVTSKSFHLVSDDAAA